MLFICLFDCYILAFLFPCLSLKIFFPNPKSPVLSQLATVIIVLELLGKIVIMPIGRAGKDVPTPV